MSSEPLPEALARLVATVRSMGFVLERDDDDPSLGNRIVELASRDRPVGRGVRLIQDRGLWMAEIELAGDWRLPYEVLRALDGGKFASRAMGHEERADTVLAALERLPTDDAGLDELRRLQEFDAEYMRRMGVDPPGQRHKRYHAPPPPALNTGGSDRYLRGILGPGVHPCTDIELAQNVGPPSSERSLKPKPMPAPRSATPPTRR